MTLRRLWLAFMHPAPDPRREHHGIDCSEVSLLCEVRAAVQSIAAARAQLATREAQLHEHQLQLDSEARTALAHGREDLARHTLERRQIVARELELLERQLASAEREAQRLALAEQQLVARIDAHRAQGRMLEARETAAAIQVRVGEALAGISAEIADVAPELARAEQRAEELEARAAAIDELLNLGEDHRRLFESDRTPNENEPSRVRRVRT